jgi:hypothetical protein
MSLMFHSKKIRDKHAQKICQTDQAKIREISVPHLLLSNTARILLQSRLGRVSSVKYYSSLSGLIN